MGETGLAHRLIRFGQMLQAGEQHDLDIGQAETGKDCAGFTLPRVRDLPQHEAGAEGGDVFRSQFGIGHLHAPCEGTTTRAMRVGTTHATH